MKSPFTGGRVFLQKKIQNWYFAKRRLSMCLCFICVKIPKSDLQQPKLMKSICRRFITNIGLSMEFLFPMKLNEYVGLMNFRHLKCLKSWALEIINTDYMKTEICPAKQMAKFCPL